MGNPGTAENEQKSVSWASSHSALLPLSFTSLEFGASAHALDCHFIQSASPEMVARSQTSISNQNRSGIEIKVGQLLASLKFK